MSMKNSLKFGFTAVAASTGNDTGDDKSRYNQMIKDCRLGYELGFDCAWVLEHHFTDYFPTPSPLILMSHLAAAFPGLSLGSCVLVVPWYNPLRLAEEISMLSHLCAGELHLAFGEAQPNWNMTRMILICPLQKTDLKKLLHSLTRGSLVKPLNIAESTIMLVGRLRLDRPPIGRNLFLWCRWKQRECRRKRRYGYADPS